MGTIYPNDADGDALRRVAGSGADMSRPMTIDFSVASPNREAADQVAQLPRMDLSPQFHMTRTPALGLSIAEKQCSLLMSVSCPLKPTSMNWWPHLAQAAMAGVLLATLNNQP